MWTDRESNAESPPFSTECEGGVIPLYNRPITIYKVLLFKNSSNLLDP